MSRERGYCCVVDVTLTPEFLYGTSHPRRPSFVEHGQVVRACGLLDNIVNLEHKQVEFLDIGSVGGYLKLN